MEELLCSDGRGLDEVPLERLEAEITSHVSRMAAAMCQWLLWVAAYDRRGGWNSWEAKSCAHWLSWKCGIAPRTAREHVFVAHKICEYPKLREAFGAGEISYCKVRAISRVVEPANETELVELAYHATGSQLEQICAKLPDPNQTDHGCGEARWSISFRSTPDDTVTVSITMPTQDAAVVRESIETKTTETLTEQSADGELLRDTIERLGGINETTARTAAAILTGTLDAAEEPHSSVLVVADLDALTGGDEKAEATVQGRRVKAEVIKRLCCDGKIQTAVTASDGEPVGIGRESRTIPRGLRTAMLRRDHHICQFPGCTSTRRLHGHHIVHWANGGPTNLDNLISLCHFHHHAVHERGWNITKTNNNSRRRWVFIDPNNNPHSTPVLQLPPNAALKDSKALRNGTAAPLAAPGEPANIHYIADVIIENTTIKRARTG